MDLAYEFILAVVDLLTPVPVSILVLMDLAYESINHDIH